MHKEETRPAGRVALLGILCALAVALSFLEGLLPVLPVPGAKLGLSNIVVMATLSSMNLPAALAVVFVKAAFALLRGGVAFLMSLAGGICSTLLMTVLFRGLHRCLSYLGIGVAGAVGHNAGQLLMSMLLVDSSLIYYAPWLLLMALAAGTLTGTALNLLMPALERLPVRLNPGLKKI